MFPGPKLCSWCWVRVCECKLGREKSGGVDTGQLLRNISGVSAKAKSSHLPKPPNSIPRVPAH